MSELLVERRGAVAVFTLNRPGQLNAMNSSMMQALEARVAEFDADPKLRVGIVAGAGRAFCAGADLKAMAERHQSGVPSRFSTAKLAGLALSMSPKPFIAAINGLAVGGGCELALDCDLRICSAEAYFALMEPRRGLLAGYAIHHLPRVIGAAAANQMLLTAQKVSASQALAWGLVSEVHAPEALMLRAFELAEAIAANAPLSIVGTKAAAQVWRKALIERSLEAGQQHWDRVQASEDAREGARAFVEKRIPVWRGR